MDALSKKEFLDSIKLSFGDMLRTKEGILEVGFLYSTEFERIKLSEGSISGIKNEDFQELKTEAEKKEGGFNWLLKEGDEGADYFVAAGRGIKSLTSREMIGYMFILIDEKGFSRIYHDVDMGEGADIFVIDSEGSVISSRNSEICVGSPYNNKKLIENVKNGASKGNTTFDITKNGEEYLTAFSQIPESNWYVICTIPYKYLNLETDKIGWFILAIGLGCLIIAMLLSVFISSSISAPLKKIVKSIKKASGGNLTYKVDAIRNDELGEVAQSFNSMIDNICLLVKEARISSRNVLDSADRIATSSEQTFIASENVAQTVQQIALSSSEQASEASEGADYMNGLSDAINKVENEITGVTRIVSGTKKLSEEACKVVDSLNEKAVKTSSTSEKIINDINKLGTHMREIKNIVKVIVGISEQTNLLSLNASIEAARAGEAGRGFAVVADEVKKLADQSKDASISINNIINSIQQQTEKTVEEANDAGVIIKQQMDAVKETEYAFKTVFGSMGEVSEQICNVESLVNDISIAREKVLELIENISAASQENAATVQEISASSEEQMAAMEELSNFAKGLKEMSEDLGEAISVFIIE